MTEQDKRFIQMAIDLATENVRNGGGPFGAIVVKDGEVIATFVLRGGEDPTYKVIYDGKWLDKGPYATIHRIASDLSRKGILHLAVQFALRSYNSLRIDTHRDNAVMRSAVLREGFRYCGIIRCWNGTERLAYQYIKP